MRCGTVTYATSQGISHLSKSFYDAGVITDVMVFRHGSRPSHMEWYPYATELVNRPFNGPAVDAFLSRVDVMMFFENPFDWGFLQYCRDRGKKTVIVPMYECTPVRRPFEPDKWICPSKLDLEYFPGSPYLPIPVDEPRWELRTRARRWLHNGGNLGLREHKGTRQILQAMQHVKSPISLTVRAQDDAGLHKIIAEVPSCKRDPRITFHYGQHDRATLFDEHDVFVMAEKYNGLSLPLAEARAAGMVVVTSDRFPMNDWLPTSFLIRVNKYIKAKVGGPYNEYDEAVVEPELIAAMIDYAYYYGETIGMTDYSLSACEWYETMSWETLKPRWIEELSR